MARRRAKVYLPRWTRGVMLPFLVLMWFAMTWGMWWSGAPREPGDAAAWAIGTIVIVFVAGLLWAMSSGKLAAYEIEFDDDDEPRAG